MTPVIALVLGATLNHEIISSHAFATVNCRGDVRDHHVFLERVARAVFFQALKL